MRPLLIFALGLSLSANAAHAQYQPIVPIEAPRNPYALPSPAAPRIAPAAPIRPVDPATEGFKPFKPYKPYAGVDTNTAPSGLYPELHRHRRPRTGVGNGF